MVEPQTLNETHPDLLSLYDFLKMSPKEVKQNQYVEVQ